MTLIRRFTYPKRLPPNGPRMKYEMEIEYLGLKPAACYKGHGNYSLQNYSCSLQKQTLCCTGNIPSSCLAPPPESICVWSLEQFVGI